MRRKEAKSGYSLLVPSRTASRLGAGQGLEVVPACVRGSLAKMAARPPNPQKEHACFAEQPRA